MSNKTIILMALLITGNMIGAGILAMPISAGIAGLLPSLLSIILLALSMLFSGFVLVREINEAKQSSFNLPSLYQKHFGVSGKWISTITNMFIFYGIMTSYLAGSTKLIMLLLKIESNYEPFILLSIFLIFTYIAISSIKIIEKYTSLLMVLLAIAFLILIVIGIPDIQNNRLNHIDWGYLPVALPVIIAGFVFHFILPSLCEASNWSNQIYKPILIGMAISVFMNITWLIVCIGVLPEFGHISLNEARLTGVPITVEMSQVLDSELFLITGSIFAIIAIATSYISVGMSLKDFLKDIFVHSFKINNNYLIIAVAFIPPLIISYFYANIFLDALNIVGGVGIVLLFGILPSIISYKRNQSKLEKIISILFLSIFSIILIATLLQTFSIVEIKPFKG